MGTDGHSPIASGWGYQNTTPTPLMIHEENTEKTTTISVVYLNHLM
jgi:hypothetical protein